MLLLPLFGAAHGHAVVVGSEPADGAVLATAPEVIRIRFNEPVSLIAAQVLDSGGRNIVASEAGRVNGGAVEIALPPGLAEGTYVASYRVVSLDGHPIGGSLVFSVGEVSAGARPAASDDRAWRVLWTAVRATLNAGLLGSAGGVLFLLVVAGDRPGAARAARIARRLATIGIAAAALSIGVQGGLLRGGSLGGMVEMSAWRAGLASPFGRSALVAMAGLALIGAGLARPSSAGRAAAVLGAGAALASYAFAGHVVTAGPRWLTVPALLAHTSAVALWIGSLLPLRAALADEDAARVLRRFSAAAVLAVGVLVVAGLVIAALQVRGFGALVTTTYGWVLLAKLALVGGLLMLAALNKWRLTPALARGDAGAARALRRTIGAELALAAAILVATAALGTTPPPRALLADHAHTPEHHASHAHHAHGLVVELASGELRATLTFASAHAGPNEVQIALRREGGGALQPKEVTFAAENPSAGVEPIRRTAVPAGAGVWEVAGLHLVPAGKWSVRVEALVSDFEKPIFEGIIELR